MKVHIYPLAVMGGLAICGTTAAQPKRLHLEAEDGQRFGVKIATDRPGFSGTGYVTGFFKDSDFLVWKTQARAGIYEVKARYHADGEKGVDLKVNGSGYTGHFDASGDGWAVWNLGKVELKDGENAIEFHKGWGYYDLDSIDLMPALAPSPLKKPSRTLSDPKASPEAKKLYNFLIDQYGKTTLSGQYGFEETAFVEQKTGKSPAIIADDLMDYSPSRTQFKPAPTDLVEKLIGAAHDGHAISISWHWNAPMHLIDKTLKDANGNEVDARWYKGFYTNASTFDVRAAMARPDSVESRRLVADIDEIAMQLKKLADAKVPVLFRPLHEAEGGWFWWGAKGPEPCIKLWRLLHQRLTGKHGLHNLVWVWNSARPEWYPGDDVVDVMSVDSYPNDRTDPLSGTWEPLLARFDGRKPLALAEFPGPIDVEKMKRFGVRWSFFISWTGGLGPEGSPADLVKRTYLSPLTINKSDLP